ncbi:MAG: hypothetical protein ACRCX2_20425 [Paraclostridium sp.]
MARRFNRKKKEKHSISGKYIQVGDIWMGNFSIGFDNRWFFTPGTCAKRKSKDFRFTKCSFGRDIVYDFGYKTYKY